MEKKKRSFQMPHTYNYYFWGDSCGGNFDAFIPLGQYDTKRYLHCEWGGKDPNSSGSGQLPLCTG